MKWSHLCPLCWVHHLAHHYRLVWQLIWHNMQGLNHSKPRGLEKRQWPLVPPSFHRQPLIQAITSFSTLSGLLHRTASKKWHRKLLSEACNFWRVWRVQACKNHFIWQIVQH
jgi:hypothetical protein